MPLRHAVAAALVSLALVPTPVLPQEGIRSERVQFERGTEGTVIEDRLTGDEVIDYVFGARAGQRAEIVLEGQGGTAYFNLLAPGADQGEAVYIGAQEGDRFEGVLEGSGDWTVRVYQLGNAADSGQTTAFRLEIAIAAEASGQGAGETASVARVSPEEGGPRRWQVRASGGLRLHSEASATSPVIETLADGAILSNLGCIERRDRTWCDVQPFEGGARGFVAAEFLVPAPGAQGSASPMGQDDSALRAGQGDFDATGTIPCAQGSGQPSTRCDFGVARGGGGDATVVVTFPDGFQRALFFTQGEFTGADASQAAGGFDTSVEREGDLYLIRVDDERYEVVEAIVFGG